MGGCQKSADVNTDSSIWVVVKSLVPLLESILKGIDVDVDTEPSIWVVVKILVHFGSLV